MKPTNLYLDAVRNIPEDVRRETALKFSVSDKIASILKSRKMTQKELARIMGKSEAEVSVWLSGQHNFTLKTLAKLSLALGTDIISVD